MKILVFLLLFLSLAAAAMADYSSLINSFETKYGVRYLPNQSLQPNKEPYIVGNSENISLGYWLKYTDLNNENNITINFTNISISPSFVKKGEYSLNISLRVADTSSSHYYYIYPNLTNNYSSIGYSGAGMWVYCDNNGYQLLFQFRNSTGGDSIDVGNYNCSYIGWRYINVDFSNFPTNYKNPLYNWSTFRLRINLRDDAKSSNIYLDDFELYDIEQGSFYAPRWKYNTTLGGDVTDTEIVPLLAYLYYNGTSGKNNESYLNSTVFGMINLMSYYNTFYDGDLLFNNVNPAPNHPMGYASLAVLKSYYYLNKSGYNFLQNVTINGRNLSFKDHIYNYAKYVSDRWYKYNFMNKNNGGIAITTNQDLPYTYTNYLIYKYFNDNNYLSRYENDLLAYENNLSFFGFLPEVDNTTKFDNTNFYMDKYIISHPVLLAGLYYDSGNTTVLRLLRNYTFYIDTVFNNSFYCYNCTRTNYSNSSMVYGRYAVYKLTTDNYLKIYMSRLDQINTTNWVPAWSFGHLLDLEHFFDIQYNASSFPLEYNHVFVNYYNVTGNLLRQNNFTNEFYTRSSKEYARIIYAYDDVKNQYFIRDNRIRNEYVNQKITLPLYYLSSPRLVGTLSSGTRVTNTEANLTLKPQAEVYVYD